MARRFEQFLDLSDVKTADTAQRAAAMKTRALAALALTVSVEGLDDKTAAAHVTDGSKDCGIDAVYIDHSTKRLVVVQSKWHEGGTASIGLGDTRNTLAGIGYLTDLQFDKFNKKFDRLKSDIVKVIDDVECTVELILVTTGVSVLGAEVQEAVDEAVNEMNDPAEILKVQVIGLKELRSIISRDIAGPRIDLDVVLASWGGVTEPYEAYYGLIDGATLARWYEEHGGRLFDSNLRKALGNTATNAAISDTATGSPEQFWYFNNGVTALCEKVSKTAVGGSNRLTGTFRVEGLTIVNGAQTVSSLALAHKSEPTEVEKTLVWVRLISLSSAPEDFASEVTRATNTQNSVEARDFIALDPKQDELRQALRLEVKKEYVFKRGEKPPEPDSGVGLQEALVALACAEADPTFAVLAKSAIGRLEDTTGRYYRSLFASCSARRLWNSVEVFRAIEAEIANLRTGASGRELAILVQGNRVITHVVMQSLGGSKALETDDDTTVQGFLQRIPGLVVAAFAAVADVVESTYAQNYVTSLFKNTSRSTDLVKSVIDKLK